MKRRIGRRGVGQCSDGVGAGGVAGVVGSDDLVDDEGRCRRGEG